MASRSRSHASKSLASQANVFAANVTDVSALSDDVLQEQLMTAQREATDARTKFEIQNRLTQNVLVMDPVLKAVHGNQQHTDFAEKCVCASSLSGYANDLQAHAIADQ